MVSPRIATLLSLAALPAIGYYTLVDEQIVAVSLVNILIIAVALFIAFGRSPTTPIIATITPNCAPGNAGLAGDSRLRLS
ncbi:hypothetical protein [Halonotius sp. GCM10025705]|uniref:hypothetical protein n=1 Tax=Halonotius sp. GCM10025705 TaxID=3252678 RepID=UPI00361B3A35